MIGREKKRRKEEKRGCWGCRRGVLKVQLNAERKCRRKKREFVGKDLLLGKGTVSFQAINKGTLWGHKEEGQ